MSIIINMWDFQIFDNNKNEYITYIKGIPNENKYYNYILGFYYGSSTRLGDLGTFYYYDTNEYIPLKMRIINNNLEVILEFELTEDIIKNIIMSDNLFGYKINNIIIYYRNLYKFGNNPYEIAGIGMYKC